MKRLLILILLSTILIASIGAHVPRKQWEYASLVLLSTEHVIWRNPNNIMEASSFFGLTEKLGCKDKGKFVFPPEYSLFEHFGNQGWELIAISGDKDSMSGAFVCWFKRPK